jgi:hypothetical protein
MKLKNINNIETFQAFVNHPSIEVSVGMTGRKFLINKKSYTLKSLISHLETLTEIDKTRSGQLLIGRLKERLHLLNKEGEASFNSACFLFKMLTVLIRCFRNPSNWNHDEAIDNIRDFEKNSKAKVIFEKSPSMETVIRDNPQPIAPRNVVPQENPIQKNPSEINSPTTVTAILNNSLLVQAVNKPTKAEDENKELPALVSVTIKDDQAAGPKDAKDFTSMTTLLEAEETDHLEDEVLPKKLIFDIENPFDPFPDLADLVVNLPQNPETLVPIRKRPVLDPNVLIEQAFEEPEIRESIETCFKIFTDTMEEGDKLLDVLDSFINEYNIFRDDVPDLIELFEKFITTRKDYNHSFEDFRKIAALFENIFDKLPVNEKNFQKFFDLLLAIRPNLYRASAMLIENQAALDYLKQRCPEEPLLDFIHIIRDLENVKHLSLAIAHFARIKDNAKPLLNAYGEIIYSMDISKPELIAAKFISDLSTKINQQSILNYSDAISRYFTNNPILLNLSESRLKHFFEEITAKQENIYALVIIVYFKDEFKDKRELFDELFEEIEDENFQTFFEKLKVCKKALETATPN